MSSKILVVDDEELIVSTVSSIFTSYGYITEGAFSGEEAIAKARTACPDLLLCDVRLPGLNGFDAALQIKEFCPQCRLLFFSAHADKSMVREFTEEFSARGYRIEFLAKPVNPRALLERVEKALQDGQGPSTSATFPM